MKLEDAIKFQKKFFKKRIKLRKSKGHDYSTDIDCLQNFKDVAKMAKILNIDITTSYGVALLHRVHKLQRECNLLFTGKKPKNEALIDTLLDGSNYIDLELECLIDDGVIKVEG